MKTNAACDRLSPRSTVLLQARCRKTSWNVFPVELGDISQGGCSIVGSGEAFAAGEKVALRIANLKTLDAEVRWVRPDKVGVEFTAALSGAVIARLASLYGIAVEAAGPGHEVA